MGYSESPDIDGAKSPGAQQTYRPRKNSFVSPTISGTSPFSYDEIRFSEHNWPKENDLSSFGSEPEPDVAWLLARSTSPRGSAAKRFSEPAKNPESSHPPEVYEQDTSSDILDIRVDKVDTTSDKVNATDLERYMSQTKSPIDSRRNQSLGLSGPFWGYFTEANNDPIALPKTDLSEVNVEVTQLTHSCDAKNEGVDIMNGSSDDCDMDVEEGVEDDKERVLNYLMVCVHDMFTLAESSDRPADANTSSSYSFRQTGESSTSGSDKSGRKRGRDESTGDQDPNDENDKFKPRKRRQDEEDNENSKKLDRKLACPYYKHNPDKHHSSGACCGPGWDSVHRIKAHLYRVHAMPLHCRRCYATFACESLLTEHSRATDSCKKRDAVSMDGFDKDQEKALKCRKAMFRANTEEEKWKLVYLILFPDTVLGEMPSPYYGVHGGSDSGKETGKSPPAPEIQEFHAFMKRELPRTIRKTLQAALESKSGPIAETLKNELESIVRDAQETLTQSYLSSIQMTDDASAAASGSTGRTQSSQPVPESSFREHGMTQSMPFANDALSQYIILPEATAASLPTLFFSADGTATRATSSTSAPQSLSEMLPDNPIMDDVWLNTFIDDEDILHGIFTQDNAEYGTFDSEALSLQNQPFDQYIGKGKEPAHDSTWTFDLEDLQEKPT